MLSSPDGTHRSAVCTHCAPSSCATGQCPPLESAGAECHPVCRRTRLQVARGAGAVWQVAHRLHPDESLGEERRPRPGLRTPATGTSPANQARGGLPGQHDHQGPSRRDRGAKKNGPQAIGKSRGGWTTKLHLGAADARTAVTVSLSPGQAHDAPEGRKRLQRLGDRPRPGRW